MMFLVTAVHLARHFSGIINSNKNSRGSIFLVSSSPEQLDRSKVIAGSYKNVKQVGHVIKIMGSLHPLR